MKAKFMEEQPPVKEAEIDGKHYVFICLNQVIGQEEVMPPMEYPEEIPPPEGEIPPPEGEITPPEGEVTLPEESVPLAETEETVTPPERQYNTYYEYDYNEFVADVTILDDIQAYPEKYLDYTPGTPPKTIDERVSTLEEDVSGIESAIKEALNA